MPTEVSQGDQVTLISQWAEYQGGPAVDVAGLTITITRITGGAVVIGPTSAGISHPGTGVYAYTWAVDAGEVPGDYLATWIGTDAQSDTVTATEIVTVTAVLDGGLVTLAETKAHLRIAADSTGDDEEIEGFIAAATEIVERHAGTVLPLARTDRLRGGSPSLLLGARPVISVTSVTLAGGSLLAASGYELEAEAGVLLRMVGDYESCWEPGRITVVYTAGRADVPAAVRLAALVIIKHLWETQRGRMGGARAAGSDEVWDPRWGYAIPRRALELMGDAPMGIA